MSGWHAFIWPADEWLIAYSSSPLLPAVTLFQIGHCLELYLKATFTKLSGDSERAIRYGHKIKELWDACKSADASFLPSYEIRDAVYAQVLTAVNMSTALTGPDHEHYQHHQELYTIAKALPDLKYGSLPWKSIQGRRGPLVTVHPNPYWVRFVKEVRAYLGYPLPGVGDTVRQYIDDGKLPVRSVSFLNELYV